MQAADERGGPTGSVDRMVRVHPAAALGGAPSPPSPSCIVATVRSGGGGGRRFANVAFADGRLGWTVECSDAPRGCTRSVVWRYDLRARTYERATRRDRRGVAGLRILPGDRVLVVRGARVETERLRFAAAPPP